MTKKEIIDYIMETPQNTNPAILSQMLDEIAGEGSGGESSDFSTATVTVATTGDNEHPILNLCAVFEEDGYVTLEAFQSQGFDDIFTVPLYKGQCEWYFTFTEEVPTATVAVTGDIAYEDATFYITGNGTITIS